MSLFRDIRNINGFTVPSKERDTWRFLDYSKRKGKNFCYWSINSRYRSASTLNIFGGTHIAVKGVPVDFENAIIVDIYFHYGRVCYCYL